MAKVLMIQGTMSNAGKSFVVAGLCRVFRQDGYRVAPFKSQNMALNSYVTKEGLEMGRAQVMQAEAAGIEPSVAMNPILLKPTSDVGSQVIVNGIARGNMDARDYFRYKKQLIPDIQEAFSRLSKQADIIVVEGAGSPAEINLKENDIVNMGLAKILGAPVLLVGDIDRGGVFAQLVGTVDLLEEEERKRIRGLVINKFRGDPSLLTSGVDMLTARTGIPTVGILPYIHVSLDDEDSLSSRLENAPDRVPAGGRDSEGGLSDYSSRKLTDAHGKRAGLPLQQDGNENADIVDLAVIRLPHISNFTDFDVFDMVPDCRIRYVDKPDELADADMAILPGSKNTIDDLAWLWRSGLGEEICQYAAAGNPVWGICGGYQMLGMTVADPDHVETKDGSWIQGLGVLPMKTTLREKKVLRQVQGHFNRIGNGTIWKELSGREFSGYEIHMGESELLTCTSWFSALAEKAHGESLLMMSLSEADTADSTTDADPGQVRMAGLMSGNVCGSYVHGIFDADGIAEGVVRALRARKKASGRAARFRDPSVKTGHRRQATESRSDQNGIYCSRQDSGSDLMSHTGNARQAVTSMSDYQRFREQQYDILADMIRQNMDMDLVYSCLAEAAVQ